VIGHDPVLQFLHIEDAVAAVCFAAELELAGVYNVASRGLIRLNEFVEALDRASIWLPPFEMGPLTSIAARLGLPHIAEGMHDRLRFGHAIDTGKIEAAGFKPSADQLDCAALLQH
jgi:UDP-glucose 4-epimerase